MSAVADQDVIVAGSAAAPPRRPSLPARLWRRLRSLRFAVTLMALIVAACIVGTLIHQEPYNPEKLAHDYGRRLGSLIGLLGLHQLYHELWFLCLLALFALSTVACALPRLRLRLRVLGSGIVHLSIVFIVAGAIVRGVAGQEGRLQLREGQTASKFLTAAGKAPLGFRVRLDDFVITRYEHDTNVLLVRDAGKGKSAQSIPVQVGKKVSLASDVTVEFLEYLPHFMLKDDKPYSASDQPVNPAVRVRVSGPEGESARWLFARFPSFHGHGSGGGGPQLRYVRRSGPIKTFESHVTVLDEQGAELRKAAILVNQPLKLGRYTLYQSSYDKKTERSSTLDVSYDPGVPLVFAGFALMPLGMAFVFYVQPMLRRRKRRDA